MGVSPAAQSDAKAAPIDSPDVGPEHSFSMGHGIREILPWAETVDKSSPPPQLRIEECPLLLPLLALTF